VYLLTQPTVRQHRSKHRVHAIKENWILGLELQERRTLSDFRCVDFRNFTQTLKIIRDNRIIQAELPPEVNQIINVARGSGEKIVPLLFVGRAISLHQRQIVVRVVAPCRIAGVTDEFDIIRNPVVIVMEDRKNGPKEGGSVLTVAKQDQDQRRRQEISSRKQLEMAACDINQFYSDLPLRHLDQFIAATLQPCHDLFQSPSMIIALEVFVKVRHGLGQARTWVFNSVVPPRQLKV